jgi:hypothetical protein
LWIVVVAVEFDWPAVESSLTLVQEIEGTYEMAKEKTPRTDEYILRKKEDY